MKFVIEILGWYGVVAILSAYALSSFLIIPVTSLTYLTLNLSGAFGVALDAYREKNYQPVVLNVVWFVVAAIGIMQYLLQ